MKDFRGMKRQRSRNRKPSGNQNNPNRAYESNGPEGTKVRGNAQTIYEKYQQLARDANSSGDRVLAENHLQHAEHYFRLIRQMQPTRPVSEFVQRDPFSNGYDDFDDEFDMMEGGETEAEAVAGEGDQPSVEDREARENGRNRDRFDRNDRNRDRNDRNDRNRDRNDRNRDNGRDNANRDTSNRDNGRDATRSDRPPFEPREPREPRVFEPRTETRVEPRPETEEPLGEFDGRRESRRERYERRRQQRLSEQEQNLNAPASTGFIASTEPLGGSPASRPAPEPVAEQPAIRDDLPAFLNRPTPVSAAPVAEEASAEEAVKPKRGRPKRKTEAATEEA